MPLLARWPFVAACLISPVAFVGCATERTAASPKTFPWVSHDDAPEKRDDLKNPTRLDLTYAQWQEQLGNLPAAEDSYRRVLEEHPESVDAMIGLARLEQFAGRTEAAEKAYRQTIRSAPRNAQALDALGQFYAAEKRWQDAATVHAQATQAAPDNAVYRQHYAVALARAGRTGEALAQFQQAVGEAEGHYNLGYIFYEQGRADLAEQQFLQAVTLRPDLEAAQAMLDELRRGDEDARMVAGQAPPPRPQVMQTAAVTRANGYGEVTPAGGTAAMPAPPQDEPLPQWQMPTRRPATSLQAEQLRNQAALSAGR